MDGHYLDPFSYFQNPPTNASFFQLDFPAITQIDNNVTGVSVSEVPIPAAAWLFASALGVVGYSGWRRKKA
jgi:hypothetical protein